MIYPVILVGGSGTRLWPLSRKSFPKQFLPLASQNSLLQDTLLRLRGLDNLAAPSFVCNEEHRFLVAEQVREVKMKPEMLMLEPSQRNTGPAITAAALYLVKQQPDAVLLVLPSDHVITDVSAFHRAIETAYSAARQGYIVTFGIVPRSPETGYGYVQRGKLLVGDGLEGAYYANRFVEKPNLATAQEYIASGDFYWNSGMFVLHAQTFIDEMQRLHPDIVATCRTAVDNAQNDLDFVRLSEAAFSACPTISVDVAVMEKTDKAAVVPADIGWSDLGSWSALWELHDKDVDGNAARGQVCLQNSRNCYVHSDGRLVTVCGVDNLVVIETADAILVAHRDSAQDVKKIVEWLNEEGRTEHETHRKVYRPWGTYEGMDLGDRFQVKRLVVNPGQKTSMQMHHHRSEHWVVVSGTAEVTLADKVHMVTENESIYIPLGVSHRLHNPGRIPLHLIEVQSGAYLGEDDIVRTSDNYGR